MLRTVLAACAAIVRAQAKVRPSATALNLVTPYRVDFEGNRNYLKVTALLLRKSSEHVTQTVEDVRDRLD